MKKIMMLILSLVLVFTMAGCKEDEENETFEFDVPKAYNVNIQELGYGEYVSLSNPTITINVKDMGEITIQLFPSIAPNTVDSFIEYIEEGSYTNNQFHRVVNGFMIQAGLLEFPMCTIPGEMTNNDFDNPLSHTAGVLSMARIGGDYDSASSQFFIVHGDSQFLDDEYASFGGVITGFNILNYIASLNDRDVNEFPIVPVYIDSITVDLNGYVPGVVTCIN
jgi:peptidyl-prolyl cis-trans isomerase B (cyclophilin B)